MTNLERDGLNLKVIFMLDVMQSEVVRSEIGAYEQERVRTGDTDTSRTVDRSEELGKVK